MENKKMTFKTNLNCGGCVAKVQNDFDNAENISETALRHFLKARQIWIHLSP